MQLQSLWTCSYFVSIARNVSNERCYKSKNKGMKRMSQTLTVKVKLIPTNEQIRLLEQSSHEYIKVINTLVSEMVKAKKSTKKSTKDIEANIPSAVKNQAIKDAKSLFATKVKKSKYKIIPILKRPVCVWNNQNYSFDSTYISIPFKRNGKSTRVKIRALLIGKNNRNLNLLKHK